MARRTYSDGERKSNRAKIMIATLGVVGLAAVVALLADAALTRFLGVLAFVVVFAAAWWWLFASRSARPLEVEEGAYLPPEYKIMKKMIKAYKKR